MNKFLKKNWFVSLIIVIFACISVYYIYDTNKGKLKGKTSDGEDVVYSVNDEDVTASKFYDDLYTSNGNNAVISQFIKAVADDSYKTTKEIKENAASQAESIKTNYQSSYGSSYESQLSNDLASTGYSDLTDYLVTQLKLNKIAGEYAANHFDDLQIRQISYILIKFEDSSNVPETPTDNEQSRMDAVDGSLNDGTSFADTATKYSEDTSTSTSGGVLGVIDKNASNLDATFLKTALSLKEGEVSDWIKSDSFGYFKIKCDASTPETLESSDSVSSPYESLVSKYDTTLTKPAIWEKATSLGVDFKGNDDIEKEVKAYFGVEDDDTDDAEASASPSASATATATSGGNN